MPPAPAFPHADIAAAVARGLRIAHDPPDPLLDPDRLSLKYAGLSQDFRNGAWRYLDDGDLPQAANKAWGLLVETIKAVSAEYGGIIHKHRSIVTVLEQLCQVATDAGDADAARQIISAFRIARDCHINFYEDELPESFVLHGLMECEEASVRLYALFWPNGAAAVGRAAA